MGSKTDPKFACFWPLQFATNYNPQKDNIESDLYAIFIGKRCFTVFFGISLNPVVSVWYYHLPFFNNVETQVPQEFPRTLPLRTPSGEGLYLTVFPWSCPYTDTLQCCSSENINIVILD